MVEVVQLNFATLPPGEYEGTVRSLDVELPPKDGTELQGADRAPVVEMQDLEIVVVEPYLDFSNAREANTAYCSELYSQWFAPRHFCGNSFELTLVDGALPAGVEVNEVMPMLIGTPEPGTQGHYPIEIEVRDRTGSVARLDFTIEVVERRPRLERVWFEKRIGTEGVLPGDVLVLDFSEAIENRQAWRRSLEPALEGDSFGQARIEPGEYEDELHLVLGSGACLTSAGTGSAVRVLSDDGGLVDTSGNPLASGRVEILEPRPESSFDGSVGVPVEVWLSHPPFPAPDIEITGLPDGLEFDGRVIRGVPKTTGSGHSVWSERGSNERRRCFWVIWEREFMAYQVDLESTRQPGELIQFEVRTPLTENLPIRAWIGVDELVPSPGAFCSFILPDRARSGLLVVEQGPHRNVVGSIEVEPRTNPEPGSAYIERHFWFYDQIDDQEGRVMIVEGVGLQGGAYEIDGVGVTPRNAGDTFAIIPIPNTVQTYEPRVTAELPTLQR